MTSVENIVLARDTQLLILEWNVQVKISRFYLLARERNYHVQNTIYIGKNLIKKNEFVHFSARQPRVEPKGQHNLRLRNILFSLQTVSNGLPFCPMLTTQR